MKLGPLILKSLLSAFVLSFALAGTGAQATTSYLDAVKERAGRLDQMKGVLVSDGLSPRSVDLLTEKIIKTHYKKDSVAIVDYTLSSNKPRFFLIDLKHGTFKVFHVSHGIASGGEDATAFSNRSGSNKSSLGFIRTGEVYTGKFGRSIRLEGISPSNSNFEERAVMLHSAEYSSVDFESSHGFWGRSLACLAVPQSDIDEIVDTLGSNSLILAYHDKLWDQAQTHPDSQKLADAPAAPDGTLWELTENRKGDPHPHQEGDPPSSDYKYKFTLPLRSQIQGLTDSLAVVQSVQLLLNYSPCRQ